MNIDYDLTTLAEYAHHDNIGHEVGIAVLAAPSPDRQWIELGIYNTVLDANSQPEPNLILTAAGARQLAASLILAAQHIDGGFDPVVYGRP